MNPSYIYTKDTRESQKRLFPIWAATVATVAIIIVFGMLLIVTNRSKAVATADQQSSEHSIVIDEEPAQEVLIVEDVAAEALVDDSELEIETEIEYDIAAVEMEAAIEEALTNHDGRFYFPKVIDENIYERFHRDDIPLDDTMQHAVIDACIAYNLDPLFIYAIIWQETHFQNISAPNDGHGYMQIMYKWHRDRMERLGVEDLMDGPGNVLVGCDYISDLMSYYDIGHALGTYNTGTPCVNGYARSVLSHYDALVNGEYTGS